MCREIPAGAIRCTEMVRILLKFHYDSLPRSILRIVVPGATAARAAFPSFAIYAHRLTGADGHETKMINWSFLSFPWLGFTDARSARFSHCPRWYPRRESNTPPFQAVLHYSESSMLDRVGLCILIIPAWLRERKGCTQIGRRGRSLPRRRGRRREAQSGKVLRSNAIDSSA